MLHAGEADQEISRGGQRSRCCPAGVHHIFLLSVLFGFIIKSWCNIPDFQRKQCKPVLFMAVPVNMQAVPLNMQVVPVNMQVIVTSSIRIHSKTKASYIQEIGNA